MSIEFYRVLHFFGIMLVFMALGGVCLHVINGGVKASTAFRKAAAATHGLGLVLVLVAGFGLLARTGLSLSASAWLWPKLLIWLILGGITVLMWRKPMAGRALWFVVPLLGLVAAWLAVTKPF